MDIPITASLIPSGTHRPARKRSTPRPHKKAQGPITGQPGPKKRGHGWRNETLTTKHPRLAAALQQAAAASRLQREHNVLMTWFAICWRWLMPVPRMSASQRIACTPTPLPAAAKAVAFAAVAPAHVAAPAPPLASAPDPGLAAA